MTREKCVRDHTYLKIVPIQLMIKHVETCLCLAGGSWASTVSQPVAYTYAVGAVQATEQLNS